MDDISIFEIEASFANRSSGFHLFLNINTGANFFVSLETHGILLPTNPAN